MTVGPWSRSHGPKWGSMDPWSMFCPHPTNSGIHHSSLSYNFLALSSALTTKISYTDREPSRILLAKLIHSLTCRKLRKKYKKWLTKSFPISSVFHSIGSNYKQWHVRYTQRQDCFYCGFFTKIKKLRVVLYNKSGKTVLLSEDVESNPGPITNATRCISSVVTGRGVSFLVQLFCNKKPCL